MTRPRDLLALLSVGFLGACVEEVTTARAALLDAKACQKCHPRHYQEWSASMHAYASDDPIFLAMNRRGQRETGGALGDFCVKCHAPVALREGLTHDGLNLAQVPRTHLGVTCTFCHSIESVSDAHDNPLQLTIDGAMLGPIVDPVANSFHRSRHSKLLDSSFTEATAACGSCHDVVNQKGTAIERTFAEWRGTFFARPDGGQGCAGCHMHGRQEAAATGGRMRRVHDHGMPGIDLALTPWPGVEEQRLAIGEALNPAVQGTICLDESTNRIQALLRNSGVGHSWPSGAASDRRAWVEVVAYARGEVIYQTGVVPDGSSVDSVADPDLWLIRDCFFGDGGQEVHMFWEAARYATNLLPGSPLVAAGASPVLRAHLRWDVPRADSTRQLPATPDRITMKVWISAVGADVVRDLVASGDLDPAVATTLPTFEVPGGRVEWTRDAVNFTYLDGGAMVSCVAPPGFTYTTIPAVSHARCDP